MAENSLRLHYEARKHIRRLGSSSRRKREFALSRLRELGPDGLIALHEAVDTQRRRSEDRQVGLSCVLLLLIPPSIIVLADLFCYDVDRVNNMCAGAILISIIVCGIASVRKPASSYQAHIIALSEIGNDTSLNRLIAALDTANPPGRRRAEIAVSNLLRSVTIEDHRLVIHKSREILYRHLGGDSIPLITSVLGFVKMVSDEAALPMVERLANSSKPAALDPDVRAEVLAILPLLREIEANRSIKGTLLRASSIDATVGETALRPAYGTPDANEHELVRASGADAAP